MFKNEDIERLYHYKAEAMPNGVSIQAYCKRNGVPFSLFDKWYTDTRHKVVRVQVEGAPKPGDTSAYDHRSFSMHEKRFKPRLQVHESGA